MPRWMSNRCTSVPPSDRKRTVPSELADANLSPRGETAMRQTAPLWSSITRGGVMLSSVHSRTVSSLEPETSFDPSGRKASDRTRDACLPRIRPSTRRCDQSGPEGAASPRQSASCAAVLSSSKSNMVRAASARSGNRAMNCAGASGIIIISALAAPAASATTKDVPSRTGRRFRRASLSGGIGL